jgi:hypothetical protein
MLTAMTFPHFRVAASFSGSPDAVGYTRHAVAIGADVPFNYRDPMGLQLRSARVYAASFKCPVRIYYGADETHFARSSQPPAKLAREHGLDVQAIAVDGGHNSAVGARNTNGNRLLSSSKKRWRMMAFRVNRRNQLLAFENSLMGSMRASGAVTFVERNQSRVGVAPAEVQRLSPRQLTGL